MGETSPHTLGPRQDGETLTPRQNLLIAVVLVHLATLPVFAQTSGGRQPITIDALRPMAVAAITAGKGDPDKTVEALDRAVKAKWGDLELKAHSLFSNTGLTVALIPPYSAYRTSLRNLVRRMEPADQIALAEVAVVAVYPEHMSAADIVRVVVKRDGQAIEPVSERLAPKEFKNRYGVPTLIHAGTVSFPMSAFEPGSVVTVTLIPNIGENIVRKFDSKQLAKLR